MPHTSSGANPKDRASAKIAVRDVRLFDGNSLTDRGAVKPGLRDDLVLVKGDPLEDLHATRNIRRIWCGGTEYRPG